MSWIKKGLELCEKATPGPWEVTDPDYPGCVTCGADTHIARGGFTNYPSSSLINHHIFGSPSIAKQEDTDFICNARTNYPRALKLLAEFKPLAEGLIPIAEDVLKLPKLNTEGARLGLEHLKQLLSELEGE